MPATPNSSAVTSLDMFDISGDGKDELLVGRRDGTVQVFNIPESHDMDNGIRMIFTEVFLIITCNKCYVFSYIIMKIPIYYLGWVSFTFRRISFN